MRRNVSLDRASMGSLTPPVRAHARGFWVSAVWWTFYVGSELEFTTENSPYRLGRHLSRGYLVRPFAELLGV